MTARLVISGRLPGLNEYISAERVNRQKAAKMKRDAQTAVCWYIRQQLHGLAICEPVEMRYLWVEPNRRRDPSNVCAYGRKVIEDALVQIGVIADDGWNEITGFSDSFAVDKENPRIEVTLSWKEN